MKKFFMILLPIMLVLLCANVSAQEDSSSDRDKVVKSFLEVMTVTYSVGDDVWSGFVGNSNHWVSNEKALRNLYTTSLTSDASVERILKKFNFEEGCFTDIDYESKQRGVWAPATHLSRMESLAKLYVAGPEKWRGSERLKTFLHAAMGYWFRTKPKCPNYWHNVVNAPRRMSSIMMMLRDELTEEELEGGLKVLDACPLDHFNTSTWRGGSNILRGILTNDDDLVIRARDDIAKKLRIVNYITGIHDDWSYQHHGAQVQFGNYGCSYFEGVSFWCRVLAGTKYEFTEEQTQIVYNFVKEGLRRCVFKGVFDPSFCGRQVFINAGRTKVRSFASSAQNMAAAMRDMASRAEGETAERYRAEAAFYEDLARRNLYLTDADSDVNGAKYFNRSDCGIYRTKDWYSSVRMHSERTIGFEFVNSENRLANFSADGAVLIMQDGSEYENLFACWDWRKVPGVTAYDDGKDIKCDASVAGRRNKTAHVGGLTAKTSVGDVMAASMELNRDGLHALKSDFFFGDCIICIGSDIKINNPGFIDVTTAIDQTRLRDEVVCGKSDGGKGSNKGVKWVHHNNRGYVSLDGSPINVSKEVQRGKWDFIQPHFKDKWDEMPIFKCWFDHPVGKLRGGKTDSYAYAILPCASASDTEAFEKEVSKGGKKASVRVLSNTADCQAVSHNGIVCAVLHKAGSYKLDGETVESEKPCIIIREGGNVSTEYFEEEMADIAERVFARAAVQFKLLDKNVSEAEAVAKKDERLFPRTLNSDGSLRTSNRKWWCSGFFPGSLWMMYERTGANEWKDLALKYTLALDSLRYRTDDHDIGFQLMCSYGKAMDAVGGKEYKAVLKDGAASLATRFNPTVGCTRSWNNKKWTYPVIIDNMMNLELLFVGATLSKDNSLRDIAVKHAQTTMKNHFRKDGSTWHLVDYDPEDGHVLGKHTVQGYADNSAWSRGQAWALYGYTMAYRYTKEKKFRDRAVKIADYLLSRLPEDGIPYWDYDAPNIPNEEKDASAAAIMASAFIELSGYSGSDNVSRYVNAARRILRTLASDEYLAGEGEIQGFLLKHSVGSKPGNSEVDVPLTYADYYFLEALMRCLELKI